MSQVTLKDILYQCNGCNAIGAFNVHNLEFIKGVVSAAERENTPVIMMINEAVLKYWGIRLLGSAALSAAKSSSVDIAVMVDHGTDVAFLKQCVDYGLDIMYDGSALPLDENIAVTCMMSEYAHARGRSIEGEIGALGLTEDGEETRQHRMTRVEEAVVFSRETKVDVLAVSVGNVHGFYKGEADIDVNLIHQISQAVGGIPVVMHGGSDIPYDTVRAAIHAGIKKFNIATDLKMAYVMKMEELMKCRPIPIQPLKLFPALADAVSNAVSEKIRIFNLEE